MGCSQPDAPEQRVRALIVDAEEAIEKKELARVRGHVSERYADENGHDRRAIEGILRLYVLRHEGIHLLTRIESVAPMPPNRAQAVVYVAMAGRPIKTADEVRALNANLYRFEITFEEERGDWRVVRAAWRPAEPADFNL